MKAMAMQAVPAKNAPVPAPPRMVTLHPARKHSPRPVVGHDLRRVRVRAAQELAHVVQHGRTERHEAAGGELHGRMRMHAESEAARAGTHGQSLPTPLRSSLESQFRASLAHVRVHDTPDAHRVARQHRANAFTVGSDVYFGRGRYKPNQSAGRTLVAHEMTHVLQHASAGGNAASPAAAEAEASTLAARSVSEAVLPRAKHRLPSTAQPHPVLRDAASLKQAIEDELDDVFVGIDNVWPQIRSEPQVARDAVRRDGALERSIRSEVSPMELLRTYLLLRFKTEAQFPVHFRDFLEATDIAGTHEARIYSILRGVTQTEREEMADMPGVVEVIEDEMSGDELRRAWALLYGRVEHTGADVSPAAVSTHLEMSERYELSVEVDESFETVEKNLTAAATGGTDEVPRTVLLEDSSLWAKVADEFDLQETWYFRMIARYGGRGGFPKLVGSAAPPESFLFPIWKAIEGGGTDEDLLFQTFNAVNASPLVTAPDQTSIPGGLKPTARQELRADPWFVPMLEDELNADETTRALNVLGATPTVTPGAEASLEEAIADEDMDAIRDLLADPGLSAADLRRLRTDPVILEEMGDELSGVQLCETSLLLKYGGASFPHNVDTLLDKFEQDPIDVAGAISFLRGLSGTPGALQALREEPGVFFMLTNSGLSRAESHTLLAAIRADQAGYQEAGSEGAYRHHTESVRTELPVHFTAAEVRLPIRCNIDKSRMKEPNEFDRGLIEDWLRAIDEVWNGKFELTNGSTTLGLVFAPYMAVGLANPGVTIFVMDWKDRSFVRPVRDPARNIWLEREMHLFLDDINSETIAHEFGHLLGNPDEYDLTPSEYTRITTTPAASPPPQGGESVAGLMGGHYLSTDVAERHAWPALAVINAVRDMTVYPNAFQVRRK